MKRLQRIRYSPWTSLLLAVLLFGYGCKGAGYLYDLLFLASGFLMGASLVRLMEEPKQ